MPRTAALKVDHVTTESLYSDISQLIEAKLTLLDEQREHLRELLNTVNTAPTLSLPGNGTATPTPAATPKRRTMSEAARKKVALRMKKYWKKRRAAAK